MRISRQPVCSEALERRTLLSVSLERGVLKIEGTDAADSIVLEPKLTIPWVLKGIGKVQGTVLVKVNGEQVEYDFHDIKRIRIRSGGGDDTIFLSDFAVIQQRKVRGIPSVIDAGDGNDSVTGQPMGDTIRGGAGHDTIFGNCGNDLILGEDGNDTLGDRPVNSLASERGNATLKGGAGDDDIRGVVDDARIFGGDGNDLLTGGYDENRIEGGNGNDTLSGDSDEDLLLGQAGDDSINGGSGRDTIRGGSGNDILRSGNPNKDVVTSGAGADEIFITEGQRESEDWDLPWCKARITDKSQNDLVHLETIDLPYEPDDYYGGIIVGTMVGYKGVGGIIYEPDAGTFYLSAANTYTGLTKAGAGVLELEML